MKYFENQNRLDVYKMIIDDMNKQLYDGSILSQNGGLYLQALMYSFAFYHEKIKKCIKNPDDLKFLQEQYDTMCNMLKLIFVEELKVRQ